jgi:3-isopropylmalate dehydrogenase
MNNRSNMVKVAVVGGEGIGPEVTAQSHRILNWFAAKRGVPMTLREAQYGIIPYLATGKVLPDDTREAMDEAPVRSAAWRDRPSSWRDAPS